MNAPTKFALGIAAVILVSGLCYAVAVDKKAEGERIRKERIENLKITKIRKEEEDRLKKEQEQLESAKREGKTPKFFVASESVDLGDVAPFSEITHKFVVRNEGEGPLSVKLGQTSCKCTLGRMAKGVLLPNEETEIVLTFKAEEHLGDFVHGAELFTNDPSRPQLKLALSGRVRFEFHADPSPVSFTNLGPTEVRSQDVLLTSGAYDSFEIVSIATKEKGITFEHEPLSAEEITREKVLSGYRLKVTFSKEAKGSVKGNLVLSLLGKGETTPKELKLPIEGARSGVLSISGSELIDESGAVSIGNVVHGKGFKLAFTAKARGEKKLLTVKEMKVEPPFLQVSLEPNAKTGSVEKTGLHILRIEIPPDAPEGNYQGKFEGKIEFVFEDPEYGSLTLKPSFAIVAEKED